MRAAPADDPPRLLFSGYPSEITIGGLFEQAKPCITLQVRPRIGKAQVVLMTTGLGDAGLYNGARCAPGGGQRTLALSWSAGTAPITVSIRPDVSRSTDGSALLEGRVIAVDDQGEAATAPLKVRKAIAPTFMKALLWFLGIVIPGLIGVAIAWIGGRIDRHFKARDAFAEFASSQKDVIRVLIRDSVAVSLYAEQVANADRAAEVWRSLSDQKILGALPESERVRMRKAFLANRPEELRRHLYDTLSRDLPDLAKLIENPLKAHP